MVRVIDLESLAPRSCWFESHQGRWILSCEEAIQIAYGTSVVLLRCLLVPEIIHGGVSPPINLESSHVTFTVKPNQKIQGYKYIPEIFLLQGMFIRIEIFLELGTSFITVSTVNRCCIFHFQEIHLTCPPNKTQDSGFKIYNAGNLPLDAVFGFSEHKKSFSVSPPSITVQPGVDAELRVAFMPTDISPKSLST